MENSCIFDNTAGDYAALTAKTKSSIMKQVERSHASLCSVVRWRNNTERKYMFFRKHTRSKMKIVYDKNMVVDNPIIDANIVWHDVSEGIFDVYGFDGGTKDIFSQRIPRDIAETVNEGVLSLGALQPVEESDFILIL